MDAPLHSDANTPAELGARLRLALEMAAVGIAEMRRKLQREHPEADDARISELMIDWLHDRAGGEMCGMDPEYFRPRPIKY